MRRIRENVGTAAILLTAMLLLGACSNSDDPTVVVFAASSLSVVLDEVAEQFEASHPEVSVQISYAGSQTVREQIVAGAPVDVAILASEATMRQLEDAELVGRPRIVATNTITFAALSSNADAYPSLDDAIDPRHLLGICAPTVPCGVAAKAALDRASVVAQPDTETANVRALVGLLLDDELDLGLIYRTDVRASEGALVALDLLEVVEPSLYPAAVTLSAPNSEAAESFVEFLSSQTGRDLFAAKGFGPTP